MDKIISKDSVFSMLEIMKDHSITSKQLLYLLSEFHGIENDDITADELVSLYNKGLIKKGYVNATALFHLKKPEQLELNLTAELSPKGSDYTLTIADKIEKEFVIDKNLTEDERKRIADKYFKGDKTIARYFIIFKSLFPVRHKITNHKWNTKFGIIHDGISLWDDSMRVGKKFLEIYKKLDIGVFLEATYRAVKDSIDFEQGRCFMTKPYKFLLAYDSYYQEAQDRILARISASNNRAETEEKIDKLKV